MTVHAFATAPAAEGDAADGPADGTPRNPSKPKRDTDVCAINIGARA
jgi:hypothetical protein